MEKIRSCGCIAVISGVTDSLDAWSWKVKPHRRDPVCVNFYDNRNQMTNKNFEEMSAFKTIW